MPVSVNVNKRRKDGKTALHLAASSGDVIVVGLLLRNGAAVNIADNNGSSPLHHASQNGHFAVVEQLLSSGATCHDQDMNHNTPVQLAILHGHIDVVRLLHQEELSKKITILSAKHRKRASTCISNQLIHNKRHKKIW